MRYFACLNELSEQPLCVSEASAEQRVKGFIQMLSAVRKHTSITKVRHNGDMTSIPLTATMSLQDYINGHTKDNVVRALLGIIIHPQVDMEDDISLQKYVDTKVEVCLGEDVRAESDGFNAAYCQGTFCVGFESCDTWKNDFFDLTVTSNNKSKTVKWACISSPLVYSQDKEHVLRKPAFDEWLQQICPVLLDSALEPNEKPVKLRNDHGKKELGEHADLLRNDPRVEGVLTSLPFKRNSKNYISRITDEGLIDVVLWWEDDGYSMRVKTTGRNAAETREIARILKEKYGRQK